MKENVKIVVIGDASVGKTSIIATYISRLFTELVPNVLSDVIVPKDVTGPGEVGVTVMDTSPRLGLGGEREVLMSKIKAADCVLAVYDASRPQTVEGLIDTWLPLVQDVSGDGAGGKAVLVVGTKADLVEADDGGPQEDEARRVKVGASADDIVRALILQNDASCNCPCPPTLTRILPAILPPRYRL